MNKQQESIKRIALNFGLDCLYGKTDVALNEDISNMYELVARETPKKPHLESDGYSDDELVYDTWICPNCEESYEVDYEKYDYCPNCGQKIDWSEYEDEWGVVIKRLVIIGRE